LDGQPGMVWQGRLPRGGAYGEVRTVLSERTNHRSARRIARIAAIEDGRRFLETEEVYRDLVQRRTVAAGQIIGVEEEASPVLRVEWSDERRVSPSPEPRSMFASLRLSGSTKSLYDSVSCIHVLRSRCGLL